MYFYYNTSNNNSNLSHSIGSHKERDNDIKEENVQDTDSCIMNRLFYQTGVQKQNSSDHALSHDNYLLLCLVYGFLGFTELKTRNQTYSSVHAFSLHNYSDGITGYLEKKIGKECLLTLFSVVNTDFNCLSTLSLGER